MLKQFTIYIKQDFLRLLCKRIFFPTLFLLKFLVCTYLNQYLFYFMFL
jgi:hypothetical protein